MNREELVVTSSPHVRDDTTVQRIMWSVIIALIPAVTASIYFYSSSAVKIIAVSITAAVLTEYVFRKIRGKEVTIQDGSAVLTGLLLALTLPPTLPLWTVFIGGVVAIGLGKQVFGGLGHNPFNPALVGRAFLLGAYPVLMTTWKVDVASGATPLNLLKMEGEVVSSYWELFIGSVGGSLGETSAFALLLGASYLIYKNYLNWRIPLSMVGTVFVLTRVFGEDPVFHVLSGGLILGAFYMATDMVTSPITKKGRWIFGTGAGIIVVIIRLYGGYPEGVMYAILLMNAIVPLLNRYTRPRSLGEVS
ncbi:MAG: RnfABCDGE type electron transport complex subunit D [Halanaerobiaceae bacterium]